MQKTTANIEELYTQYSGRLYHTSLRIVGNTYDAEEIMQDTFIKYYNYPQKEEIREIQKWLSSICIRKSIDVLRARNHNILTIEEYKETGNNIVIKEEAGFLINHEQEQEQEQQHTIKKIKEALATLPDKYRLILSLHLFEGYDYTEIEQITGIKEGYIRSLYMRGKAKLAESLTNTIQENERFRTIYKGK
ncbi:MAG: RNA polymerase sigma factor [Bacteroidales bacterium]